MTRVEEISDETLDKITGGMVNVRQDSKCSVIPSHYVCALGCTNDKTCGTCIYNPNRGSESGYCDLPNTHE